MHELDNRFSVTIGDAERHMVAVCWPTSGGEVVILVDGVKVLEQTHAFELRTLRRYRLPVGVDERHDVVVEKHEPFAIGARRRLFRIVVDGHPVGEVDGRFGHKKWP
jgi:hypothetical protein